MMSEDTGNRQNPQGGREVKYGIAADRLELGAAFRLVHDNYLRCGYISRQPHGIKVDPYSLLPGTTAFVAKVEETVVATMSLIADSPVGLPMEAVYPDEIAALRAEGCRVGEVSALADRRAAMRRSINVLLELSRLLFLHARSQSELTDLCIAVHPHHVDYYRKLLKFEPLGGLTYYDAVHGAPAIALRLNIASLELKAQTDARLRRLLKGRQSENSSLEKTWHFTDEDARYFLVERSNALAQAPARVREHIERIYPSLSAQVTQH